MFDLFYLFGGVWDIVYIIAIVVLFNKVSKLSRRLDKLQNSEVIKSKTSALGINTELKNGDALSEYANAVAVEKNAPQFVTSRNIVEEPEASPISDWFKENPILKIGILMILVGFGWFVSYAFIQNWIGPLGRITLGVVLGTLVTIFGTFRLGVNRVQGNAFTILGTALVIITILAGEYYYSFFTPLVVLLIVFMVSLYVVVSAMAHSDEKLALYGVIISLIAPYLSHTTGMDKVVLFFYLAVISVSSIWVSIAKNWKSIILTGITGVLLYSTSSVFAPSMYQYDMKYLLLFISYITSLIYMFTNIWIVIKNKFDTSGSELYISVINSIVILGFTLKIVPKVYQSLTLAGWMLIFAITGFFVFMKTRNQKLFYIHSCISIFLLAIATSIELSGPTLVIAFAIESAIIALTTYLVTNNINTSEMMSTTMFLPAFLSLESIASNEWSKGIIHSDFFVLVIMAVMFAILGLFYKLNEVGVKENTNVRLYQFYIICSSFYVFTVVWLCSHSLIPDDDTAVFISLFVYTIVGLGAYFTGIFSQNGLVKKYGTSVLVLVVIRLLLVDVWNMELSLRVITFIVLGVMFISTAFISKNHSSNNNLTQ